MNQKACEDLGGKPDDFIGKTVIEVFGESLGRIILDRFVKLITTGFSWNYEDEVELPSGKKWFLSNYHGIINGNRDITGIQIISADITAQKELERKIELQRKEQQRLENELYHAFRLSNMGQMVTELSHEINQPLTAINSLGGACLQILESGTISSPLFYDAIDNIVKQSERDNQIIN